MVAIADKLYQSKDKVQFPTTFKNNSIKGANVEALKSSKLKQTKVKDLGLLQ